MSAPVEHSWSTKYGESTSWEFGESFEWKVRRYRKTPTDPWEWEMYLPHQCDSWSVTEWSELRKASFEEAMAEMDHFVAEASRVLTWMQQIAPPEPPEQRSGVSKSV